MAVHGRGGAPVGVVLDTLHEQVGDPQTQEEVSRANLFGARVLAQVQERKDVGVPRLNVHGE
jgi:hypothetical protein